MNAGAISSVEESLGALLKFLHERKLDMSECIYKHYDSSGI